MTSKKAIKVVSSIVLGSAIVAVAKRVHWLIFNFQWNKCNKAYRLFMKHNEPFSIAFDCVGEPSGIPIFAYDSKIHKLEKFVIPKGYVLLKVVNTFGKTTYAFAKSSSKLSLFPHHTILCYFVDAKEWHAECN